MLCILFTGNIIDVQSKSLFNVCMYKKISFKIKYYVSNLNVKRDLCECNEIDMKKK